MKRRSMIAMAAALCICGAMSGCGSSSNSSSSAKTTTKTTSAAADTSAASEAKTEADKNTKAKTTTTTEATTISNDLDPTDEILNADIFSMKAQFGDTVFTFPLEGSELFAAGATCSKSENTPETAMVGKHDHVFYGIMYEGVKYSLKFYHKEGNTTLSEPIKDCIIHYPTLEIDDSKIKNGSVILPKGVYLGMPKDDFLAAWGEPSYQDVNTYYYSPKTSSAKSINELGEIIFKVKISSKTKTVEFIYLDIPDYS